MLLDPRIRSPHGVSIPQTIVNKKCPVCDGMLKISIDNNTVKSMITTSYINNDNTFLCPGCSVMLQFNDDEVYESNIDTSNDRAYPCGYNPCDSCDVPNNKHLPCMHRKCPCLDCDNKGLGWSCNECNLIPVNNLRSSK